MFDLTTIQLRNAEARINGQADRYGDPKLRPGELVRRIKIVADEYRKSPIDVLDASSRK